MTFEIHYHDAVLTADDHHLGMAQRLFHCGENSADVATEPYDDYLKVVDQEIGDAYYIPLSFVEGRTESGAVLLKLSLHDVQEKTLTRTPRVIAYDMATATELPVR
jgi:hypothetical protein